MTLRGLALALFLLAPLFTNAQENIFAPTEEADAAPIGTVDLLWQGETYTPPFYLGRALWSGQSRLTIVAVPHVDGYNASSLIYKWVRDGEVLGSASGAGKRTLAFNDSVLSRPVEIELNAYLPDGTTLGATARLNLAPVQPRLLVVEDSPLYGLILERAVRSTHALRGEEVTFAALPLFAPVSNRTTATQSYNWRTNTGDARTGATVTYRIPEGATGSSEITVRAENKNTLMQAPEKSFLVEFANPEAF